MVAQGSSKERLKMYLMYVDECGDSGMGEGASNYFMLSAVVLHESQWAPVMNKLWAQRKVFAQRYGLPVGIELHAGEMMGRTSKAYSAIRKRDRVLMLRDAVKYEATMADSLRVINVVNDKRGKSFGYDVFGATWDALINRFENTIEHGNFPGPSGAGGSDSGLIIVDETDEKKLRALIRRMRHGNVIMSMYDHDATVRHDLRYVIEDPLHKRSDTSMLIQMCDVNAYFLKQTLEPSVAAQKYKVKNLFYSLEPVLLKQATRKDGFGIVRL